MTRQATNLILVVGSSNTDMIISVGRLPKPGETLVGGRFACVPGGKGANQAVAAARAGGRVTFLGRIGCDMFGDRALAGLGAERITVRHVVRDRQNPSGVALIFVDGRGENCIAVASGSNAALSPADIQRTRKAFATARVVLLQLETPLPTVQAAATRAAQAGAMVILNPAPAPLRRLPARLLKDVHLLTPNETEATALTGRRVTNAATAARAAEQLLACGVQQVIITLGARGAYVAGPDFHQLVPGYRVRPTDTTGAGDVFNGALAVALAEGQALLPAARFANAAAAISVTRPGAQASAPSRREIERFLRARA